MTTMPPKTQVLIVDDHPILRHGIAQLIEREDDLRVCAAVGSVEEAVEILGSMPVDLAVVDLTLEGRSGMELIKRIKMAWPSVRALVLSMHDERLYAERALRAGARGYVMKQEATRKIVTALRTLMAGRVYLSEGIASELLERLTTTSQPGNDAVNANDALPALSNRELEVLRLIGRGFKTGEIAETLQRSVHTIEAHRASIKRKLGLKTGAELTRMAFQVGSGDI